MTLLLLMSLLFPFGSKADSSYKKFYVRGIEFHGNERTKKVILLREMVIHQGDSLNLKEIKERTERSRLNLLNTALFTFVTTNISFPDSNNVSISIDLSEAWYTWPMPIFELVDRNFNEWWRTRDIRRSNIGLYMTQYNCRGMNETFDFGFRVGYTQSLDFQYTVPYLSARQTGGGSIGVNYSRNHEVVMRTHRNHLVYYKDPEEFTRHQYNYYIRYFIRRGYYETHNFKIGYKEFSVSDSVIKFNPEYFPVKGSVMRYPYFSYFYKRDYRDLKAYPLKGNYFDIELLKVGLPLDNNNLDEWFITLNYKWFHEFSSRWHFAAGWSDKFGFVEKPSFYNQVFLGYEDLLRGFEYYVIPGQHYSLLQTNFKYTLLKTKVIHLDFIPLEKFKTIPNAFYINLFFDSGYVSDHSFEKYNGLANQFLYSFGAGLDYVTYYSVVWRVDYSINKMGDRGVYLHFTMPI